MMHKYEIMFIIPPTETLEKLDSLLKKSFQKVTKFEKMERTELAYQIKKSKVAIYALAEIESDPSSQEVQEFIRRANIDKAIWRYLIINLTTEKGINKAPTPMKKSETQRDRYGNYRRSHRTDYRRRTNYKEKENK